MTAKQKLSPVVITEVKDYITKREETGAQSKYIRRDAIRKFSLTNEEWDEYFSDKPKPQTNANRSGTDHLQKAISQPSGKKVLEEMASENEKESVEKLLGLDKETLGPEIVITKAKITKTDTLEVEYSLNGDTGSINRKKPIHQDLKSAFDRLVKHLAIIYDTKEFKRPAVLWDDVEFLNLKVLIAYSIAISSNGEGVVISGKRQVGSKQHVLTGIHTEFSSENEQYAFSGYLKKDVDACMHEVVLYLGGKYAEDPQISMESEPGFMPTKKVRKVEALAETADNE